jgi:hypothetical protein
MNIAVAVAIGIVATILILAFGTLLVLTILFMRSLARQIAQACDDAKLFTSQWSWAATDLKKLVPLAERLSHTLGGLTGDMQMAAEASLRSADSVAQLNTLLTGAKPQERRTLATPPSPPMREVIGRPTIVPPSPMYDQPAPPEDGSDVLYQDDEEMAHIEEREQAREQGYETDPEADFPQGPLAGVGAEVR